MAQNVGISSLAATGREKSRVAWVSVGAALALTASKLVVGLQTNSLGILSDAAHSGLDMAGAILTLVAVRVSSRPADKSHSYGHAKAENLSALAQTGLLLATSVWIMVEAVNRLLFTQAEVDAGVWAFGVTILAIFVDFSRSRALRAAARRYRSPALEADAYHFATDLWSSGAVLLGLLGVRIGAQFGMPFLARADAAAGLLVGCIVLWICITLVRRNVNDLMDAVSPGLRAKVAEAARVPGVVGLHRVRVRMAGPASFADLKLSVERNTPLEQAHRIAADAEAAVQAVLPGADVVVHVSPVPGTNESLLTSIRILAARHDLGVHDLHLHDNEGRQSLHMHVEVSESLSLAEAHSTVTVFETALRAEFPELDSVVTHLEPVGDGSVRLPGVEGDTEQVAQALEEISAEIGICFQPHELAVHRCAGRISVSFHCRLHPSARLRDAHAFSGELERRLRLRLPHIDRVTIRAEPIESPGAADLDAGRYQDSS